MKPWFYLLTLMLTASCVSEKAPEDTSVGGANGTTGTTSGGSTTGTTATGTDPLYAQSWHLKNTGQGAYSLSTGTSGEDINVESVHSVMDIKGRGVRVAVSDDGVDYIHPDLQNNNLINDNRDYSLPGIDWYGVDPSPKSSGDAHGTSVSGIIAALGWNGIGSRGVAPESEFAAFLYLYGETDPPETAGSKLTKELDQAYGDFDIFNYSYGYNGYIFKQEDDVVRDSIKQGTDFLRSGYGANYVQSAGNSYVDNYEVCADLNDPSSCFTIDAVGNTNAHETLATPYKIVVGALNARGTLASYSTTGSGLWVSAPAGENGISEPAIITTDMRGCLNGYSYKAASFNGYFDYGYHPLNIRCDYSNSFNGTSAAAPVVSGVIALMLEKEPALTWRDVKHILAMTADKVDYDPLLTTISHPLDDDLSGYTYDEKWVENQAEILYSNLYGFGRVNAEEAVKMADTYNLGTLGTFENTIGLGLEWFYDSGVLAKVIPDQSATGVSDTIWVGHNLINEAVEIEISSTHLWPGELAVHLISPEGTESRLLNINSYIYSSSAFSNTRLISNAFYGEESHGYWTIKVYDGSDIATGNLTRWKININGHKKSTELSKPHPPTSIDMVLIPHPSYETPEFSFTPSSSPASIYEAAVGLTPYDESVKEWTSVGPSITGHKLNVAPYVLQDNQTYYLKLRSRNGSQVSYPQVLKWSADL